MDVRLKEITRRNAERLYNDAKLLCAMQRSPSAMALAVLAVEEAGRIRHRARQDGRTPETDVRSESLAA